MTYQEALDILGIKTYIPTLREVKQRYRQLAQEFHPDKEQGNAHKFLLVNAAYEKVKENVQSGVNLEEDPTEEIYEELAIRIQEINKAFELAIRQVGESHATIFREMVQELVKKLNSYTLSSEIHDQLPVDFQKIVDSGIIRLKSNFNGSILSISEEYDDWINGFLKDTYKSLEIQELSHWQKSSFFRQHLKLIGGISLLSSLIFLIAGWYALILFFPLSCLGIGILFYYKSVRKTYSLEKNIIELDKETLCLTDSAYDLTIERKNAQDENQGLGVLAGAAWGASKGGMGGAFIGALAGGLLGGLFGEPLHELRQRMGEQLQKKLIEIEDLTVSSLNEQIPQIHQQLINLVIDNYQKNKQNVVKLLMYGQESAKTRTINNEKDNIPILRLNSVGIIMICTLIFIIMTVIYLVLTA